LDEQRHILVKGCGKSPTAAGTQDDSQSAGDRSDDVESEEEEPELKKEL
jgi:hypothetical protein